MDRYHRQTLVPEIGQGGQEALARSRVVLIGCGALGSVIADQLARAGAGFIRIIDRDIVELTNLQRQVLFDESDAAESLPKAVAAARKLARINSAIRVDPIVADVDSQNIERLVDDSSVILDGTDNVATRYLINDVSIKLRIPWVYGACVGTEGRVMVVVPSETACLRCVFPEAPAPGELPTCDTAGVLGPAATIIASLQSIACIKLLTGQKSAVARQLLTCDLWSNRFRALDLTDARRADCPACGAMRFDYLDTPQTDAAQLCGRDAVQVRASSQTQFSPANLELKLRPFGTTSSTPYFVRCALHEHRPLELTVFLDGRTIVHGTNDRAKARAICARYIGS